MVMLFIFQYPFAHAGVCQVGVSYDAGTTIYHEYVFNTTDQLQLWIADISGRKMISM